MGILKFSKKLFLSFALLLIVTTTAQAQSIFYIKGALGPAVQSDTRFFGSDIEFRASGLGAILVAMGINVGPMLSTELEISARNHNIHRVDGVRDYGSLDSSAIMLNGVFNLPLQMGYSLNVGAGVGVLSAEIVDGNTGDFADGSTFGAQLMIGGEAEIASNLALTFEYKHLVGFDLELSGTGGAFYENLDYKNNSVLIGLKYLF